MTGHAAAVMLLPRGDTVGHTVDTLTCDIQDVASLGRNSHPLREIRLALALICGHSAQHVKDYCGLTGVGLADHQRDGVFLQPLADKEANRGTTAA